ncbi:pentapeptide repeat-containing protein [Achromobacter kerstersii]|uniref:pentapeptide repeat-containing protein n=1 Tax=Achromobacter kerstersii TaxID=1353890 RepID=UPI003B8A8211
MAMRLLLPLLHGFGGYVAVAGTDFPPCGLVTTITFGFRYTARLHGARLHAARLHGARLHGARLHGA